MRNCCFFAVAAAFVARGNAWDTLAPTAAPTWAPTASPTAAPTYAPTSYEFMPTMAPTSCRYAFATGESTFTLPKEPTGDTQLNVDNPIVSADGTPIQFGCNSDEVSYYSNGEWLTDYPTSNGQTASLSHQFYATATDEFKVATIQPANMPYIFEAICGAKMRAMLNCNNNEFGCIEFMIVPNSADYTC